MNELALKLPDGCSNDENISKINMNSSTKNGKAISNQDNYFEVNELPELLETDEESMLSAFKEPKELDNEFISNFDTPGLIRRKSRSLTNKKSFYTSREEHA